MMFRVDQFLMAINSKDVGRADTDAILRETVASLLQ
jgi:hypothetical protein